MTRKRLTEAVVTKSEMTGICEIDIAAVEKNWNHNACISQYGDEFTLCQYHARAGNFTKTSLKVRISPIAAYSLVERLGLQSIGDPLFARAQTWRRPNDEVKI